VISLKAPVNAGQVNTIKIGIADASDTAYDSNLLIMGDSVQTIALAIDDKINITANGTRTFDILANDRNAAGTTLTITQINGVNVVAGQTVTLFTGQTSRLNADGTITVTANGTNGVENFTYTVSDGTNTNVSYVTLTSSGSASPDGIVSGTSGNDTIDTSYVGNPDGDKVDNNDGLGVQGTTGNADLIYASAGNDSISAGVGNDIVYGGSGNHTALGGAGDDKIYSDAGNDLVAAAAGNDSVEGGAGNGTLYGGAGNDSFVGGSGADSPFGGDDRDTFFGGAGDCIDGGEGGHDDDVPDLTAYGFAATNFLYDPLNHENGTVKFLDATGHVTGTLNFSHIEKVIACFTPGTLVLTAYGKVAVEDLMVDDLVLTRDNGFQPIRWFGRRDLSAAKLAAAPQFNPMRIAQRAMGRGLPERDMQVSPQHRMLINTSRADLLFGEPEVWAAAMHLIGMPGITRATPGRISYFHILFDEHQLVCADGAWSESFQPGQHTLAGLERGQRQEIFALFPDLSAGVSYPARA